MFNVPNIKGHSGEMHLKTKRNFLSFENLFSNAIITVSNHTFQLVLLVQMYKQVKSKSLTNDQILQ